jgi:hypothetical protein
LARITPALSFDPSAIFASKWLDPLLNHLRSTSPTTVNGAKAFWEALSLKCHETESLVKVAEGVSKLLTSGKVNSWEHRVIMYNALSSLAQVTEPIVSQKALEGYFAMTAKEAHEQAMATAVDGIGRHLTVLIYNDEFCAANKEFVEKVFKTSTDGLNAVKPLARKSWANAVGATVWDHKDTTSVTLSANIVKYLQALFKTFNKIIDKPLMWKDGPVEAYVMIAMISGRIQHWPTIPQPVVDLLKTQKYPSQLLVSSPKPSYLLWDRIYTKALSPEEGLWLVRALTSVFMNESQDSLEKAGAGHLAAQALVWIITSHPDHNVRRAAYQDTSAIAATEPIKLSHFLKQAIKQWFLDIENNVKDSTAVASTNADNYNKEVATTRLASVLNAMTSYAKDLPESTKGVELIDIMILAHHQYIASPTNKYNWITLVQRANVDPGKLVREKVSKILELLKNTLQARQEVSLDFPIT